MGVHSTLFGPVKYAILPQDLKTEELVGGNGMVEMGTFVAILLGTIAGGVLVAVQPSGPVLAGSAAVAVAVAGWLISRGDPADAGAARRTSRSTGIRSPRRGRTCASRYGNRVVWLSMLGISWFWFYGATFLTQFPNFAKDMLGGDEHVVTLLLALFSIGIGVGSLLCERLSGRKVEIGPRAVRLDRPHGLRRRPVVRDAIDARDRARRASARSSRSPRTGASWPTSC